MAVPALTHKEALELYSNQITKEEGLIHSRLTWMLTLQGFLFLSLVGASRTDVEQHAAIALLRIIPWLGIASAVLAFVGVVGAYLSIDNIKSLRNKFKTDNALENEPPGHGTLIASFLGRVCSLGFSMLIVLAWIELSRSL